MTHPLDPLSTGEAQRACDILKASGRLGPRCRFPIVQLAEPANPRVLAGEPARAKPSPWYWAAPMATPSRRWWTSTPAR